MKKGKKFAVPKPLKSHFIVKEIEHPKERIFDFIFIGFLLILMLILAGLYFALSLNESFWRQSHAVYGAIILVFIFLGIVVISIFISRTRKEKQNIEENKAKLYKGRLFKKLKFV